VGDESAASKKSHILAMTVTIIIVMLFLSLHGKSNEALSRIRTSGIIRVGYAVEPPFAMHGDNGDVIGESPDIAKKIAQSLQIAKIEWVQTNFDSLINELDADRFDVIAAGMFITPERAKRVCFSCPTLKVGQGILVKKGNPLNLSSYRTIVENKNIKVAALTGSVEEQELLKSGLQPTSLISVPDALTGLKSVEAGHLDCPVLSSVTLKRMAAEQQTLLVEVVAPLSDRENFGYSAFAFRKQDKQLAAAWNQALEDLIGSAGHLDIIARYGLTVEDLPDMKLEELAHENSK
jgi:polar amino acid transport system substrate-binding protein